MFFTKRQRQQLVIIFTLLTCGCLFLTGNSIAIAGKININTATLKDLTNLPFIGATKAEAIIKYRQTNGPYLSLSELKEISEIGKSTFQAITPYLTISGSDTFQEEPLSPKNRVSVFPKIKTSPGQIIMLPNGSYYKTLVSSLRQAKKDITIAMFIFKTTKSPTNKAALLVKELIAADNRGVDVSVTLDKSNYDKGINKENNKVAKKLRRHNITVRFDSEKRTTHAKIVVIDNRFCFVGSHNFTQSAMTFNNEFSLLIDSRPLAKELKSYIAQIQ